LRLAGTVSLIIPELPRGDRQEIPSKTFVIERIASVPVKQGLLRADMRTTPYRLTLQA